MHCWIAGAFREVFAEIGRLAIELGDPKELMAFYNLRCVAEDLLYFGEQWYGPQATSQNLERLMQEEVERFVSTHRAPQG